MRKEIMREHQPQQLQETIAKPVTSATLAAAIVLAMTWQSPGHAQNTSYSQRAPLDQYMMPPDAEIAMARSAAPESISKDAEILVMGRQGYTTAIKGTNGFVCIVERGWTAAFDDPVFWNPKVRGPICFNPAGARSPMPLDIKKTEWALAGRTKAQMAEDLKAALEKHEFTPPEPGAMCYMMSKQQSLGEDGGSWYPHLMFFIPQKGISTWGADLPGSPILSSKDDAAQVTVFMVPVRKWSDGSSAMGIEEHVHKKEQP